MSRVLVVDDNPMVLHLLAQALAPLAEVTAVGTPEDALNRALAQPPDLIVTDYRMSGMDGYQLVQQLRAHPTTAGAAVILTAAGTDIASRLKPAQDLVEEFLEKPFFVGEARTRVKRILDKIALEKMAREAPGETKLRGSLAQMSVIDLLQSLELGRKTCSLTLANPQDERCQVFFADGQIQHATYGDLSGDEAVYKVLTWMEPAGTFQIDFSSRSNLQTTTRSTQGLLMEGLRLLDEANRDAGEGV